jgi:hypothetical protein
MAGEDGVEALMLVQGEVCSRSTMMSTSGCGRSGALRTLAGGVVTPVPVALFTWGFDYTWKAAGLAPWELACGDLATWHRAYLALLERHRADLIFYDGAGASTAPPRESTHPG